MSEALHHTRANWRKSIRSGTGEACVEVADLTAAIGVRDSKNPDGPKLILTGPAFAALLARVKRNDLDL